MSYETKLYIGEVADFLDNEDRHYFQVVGMVDLSNPGYTSEIATLSEGITACPVYMYGLDGNIKFTKDQYSKSLTAYSLEDVIKALTHDHKRDPYRRFAVALAMLKAIREQWQSAKRDVRVVFWGY